MTKFRDKSECDLLIVIGSSLKVRPVALIPSSLPPEVPQILINRCIFGSDRSARSHFVCPSVCLSVRHKVLIRSPNLHLSSSDLKPDFKQSVSSQSDSQQAVSRQLVSS